MAEKDTRTEKATPRRRGKYRSEGKIAFSREILSLSVLFSSGLALFIVIPNAGERVLNLFRTLLGGLDRAVEGGPEGWHRSSLHAAAAIILPVGMASVVGALAGGFSQTKGLFTFKSFNLNLGHFNPLPRLKQLFFSKESLIAILQSTAKVAVIVAFTYQLFFQEMEQLMAIGAQSLSKILGHTWQALFRLGGRIAGIMILFAALDYVLTRRRMERDMRMSKQEIRDEHREHDGDPEIKRRQRARAREILRQRMLAQVPRADVVLVNPTHYAVALRYDSATVPAPQVIAKGQDEVAARIRDVARSHQVPVVHNPPLARALYAEVKVGRMIPMKLYAAVAEVLAYVYRLRGRLT